MNIFRVMLLIALTIFADGAHADNLEIRFVAVDIYLQSTAAVAAWQFELMDRGGRSRVVGVEGGDSPAYLRAPYYDREAVQLGQSDRIVVADYSLSAANELPSGRFRVATIHLAVNRVDVSQFDLDLITATNNNGVVVDATVSFAIRTRSQQ